MKLAHAYLLLIFSVVTSAILLTQSLRAIKEKKQMRKIIGLIPLQSMSLVEDRIDKINSILEKLSAHDVSIAVNVYPVKYEESEIHLIRIYVALDPFIPNQTNEIEIADLSESLREEVAALNSALHEFSIIGGNSYYIESKQVSVSKESKSRLRLFVYFRFDDSAMEQGSSSKQFRLME